MNLAALGKRIQERRGRAGLSQEKLALITDISTYHMGSIETGKRGPSLQTLINISIALNVTIDSLLIGQAAGKTSPYVDEIAVLLADCTDYDRSVLLNILFTTFSILRGSRHLLESDCPPVQDKKNAPVKRQAQAKLGVGNHLDELQL